jgi:hypothetical protein
MHSPFSSPDVNHTYQINIHEKKARLKIREEKLNLETFLANRFEATHLLPLCSDIPLYKGKRIRKSNPETK